MVDEDLGTFVKGTDIKLRYNKLHGFLVFECPHKNKDDDHTALTTLCRECASIIITKLIDMGFAEQKEVK